MSVTLWHVTVPSGIMPPSSNWSALKKSLQVSGKHVVGRPRKKQRVDGQSTTSESPAATAAADKATSSKPLNNRESVESLRNMVLGRVDYPPDHLLPGRYLAVDCEMVGIAGDPKHSSLPGQRDESSLARVSIVNYHGAVQLDVFVKQRERVTDWRTAYSGVRESDMVNAKSFSEVQKLVSDLLKDRILVGHAVHNDLKVLLLAHPYHMTRDTQALAGRHGTLVSSTSRAAAATSPGTAPVKVRGNRKPALRKLVQQELGMEIQTGEHSSVIDARATMAIYRLHRKTWDQGFLAAIAAQDRKRSKSLPKVVVPSSQKTDEVPSESRKRPRDDLTGSDDDTDKLANRTPPNPSPVNRKGISSGLSVVVKKRKGGMATKDVMVGTRGRGGTAKSSNWWGTLG